MQPSISQQTLVSFGLLMGIAITLGACVSSPRYTTEEVQQKLANHMIPPSEFGKSPLHVGLLLVPELCTYQNIRIDEGCARLMRNLFEDVTILSLEDLQNAPLRPPILVVPEISRVGLYPAGRSSLKDFAARFGVTYSFWNENGQEIWVATYCGTGTAKGITDTWHEAIMDQFKAAQKGIALSRFWTLDVFKAVETKPRASQDTPETMLAREQTDAGEHLVLELPGDTEMQFVKIIPGTFAMGSPSTEEGRLENEGPQCEIQISKPFYLGTYEVTREQWRAVMNEDPLADTENANCQQWRATVSQSPSIDLEVQDTPVTFVSWYDCQRFIMKINTLGLGTFRLPSEAEWEYACRAGTKTRFYWGDDLNEAEIDRYALRGIKSDGKLLPYHPRPVGTKEPNAWGLYDMSGSVGEWCDNRFGGSAESPSLYRAVGKHTWMGTLRGGCSMLSGTSCRSAMRVRLPREWASGAQTGLRLVRDCP